MILTLNKLFQHIIKQNIFFEDFHKKKDINLTKIKFSYIEN